MSRASRLERLESSTTNGVDDPSLCPRCQGGEALEYRRDFDLARLTSLAEGKAGRWEGNPEEAQATIQQMVTNAPPELDHCGKCGELTDTGYLRKWQVEWRVR